MVQGMNKPGSIVPTVGRVVWYWPQATPGTEPSDDPSQPKRQPHAATIAYVIDDTKVNLSVVDHAGVQYGVCGVTLHMPTCDVIGGGYAQWMPYQAQQAEKKAP